MLGSMLLACTRFVKTSEPLMYMPMLPAANAWLMSLQP